MNAVAEQIRIVSMNTESICTSPCFTGWETAALAAAFGAEPTPASLHNAGSGKPSEDGLYVKCIIENACEHYRNKLIMFQDDE